MASEVVGRVTFANGAPASGVQVRVFDKDAPGKGDDDLTITPGITDANGAFTVTYDPGRYQDFASLPFFGLRRGQNGEEAGIRFRDPFDILTPYVQFRYNWQGTERVHEASLEAFQAHFALPEYAPIQFRPSQHGFQFVNAFRGYMLPFTVPFLPEEGKVKSIYGLCGGMSSAALDYLLCGRSIPQVTEVPRRGSRLHRYLFRRAIDTFAMGESILRFARWMALPEDGPNGTYRLTLLEFEKVRQALDEYKMMVIGLVFDRGGNVQEVARNVWNNHQVLAYGYEETGEGGYRIHLYDPNYPKADDVFIQAERVQVGGTDSEPLYGLRCTEMRGDRVIKPVRGFFPMPYEPVDPPADL